MAYRYRPSPSTSTRCRGTAPTTCTASSRTCRQVDWVGARKPTQPERRIKIEVLQDEGVRKLVRKMIDAAYKEFPPDVHGHAKPWTLMKESVTDILLHASKGDTPSELAAARVFLLALRLAATRLRARPQKPDRARPQKPDRPASNPFCPKRQSSTSSAPRASPRRLAGGIQFIQGQGSGLSARAVWQCVQSKKGKRISVLRSYHGCRYYITRSGSRAAAREQVHAANSALQVGRGND